MARPPSAQLPCPGGNNALIGFHSPSSRDHPKHIQQPNPLVVIRRHLPNKSLIAQVRAGTAFKTNTAHAEDSFVGVLDEGLGVHDDGCGAVVGAGRG